MSITRLYNGDVKLTFDKEAHAYFASIKGGRQIPVDGTTSVIKRALGMSPAIGQWMANSSVDEIKKGFLEHYSETQELMEVSEFLVMCDRAKTASKRVSKVATDIGSAVHAYAESYLNSLMVEGGEPAAIEVDGTDSDKEDKIANGCAAVEDWVNNNNVNPVFLERLVFSKDLWYAGTMDVLAYVDDELCVVDFKTSKPFRNAWKGPYVEMALQLGAYAIAIEEEFSQYKVDAGWVVRLDKETGECDPHRVKLDDGPGSVKEAWRKTRAHEDNISKLQAHWKGYK